MPDAPSTGHRRSIRLSHYDYAQPGAYFITICARDKECFFGKVIDTEVELNESGKAVQQCWLELPEHFAGVDVDAYVVMPNHVHGIIVVHEDRARRAVPLRPDKLPLRQFGAPEHATVPTIVRSFKAAATKLVNELNRTPGAPLWQRNYHEHVVRNEEDLNQIRVYIAMHPAQWAHDGYNPSRIDCSFPL